MVKLIFGKLCLNEDVNRNEFAGKDDLGEGERWRDFENGLLIGGSNLSKGGASRYVFAYEGAIDDGDQLAAGLELSFAEGEKKEVADMAVIDALLLRYGTTDAIERLSGSFALAIWDKTEKELLLVLDRIGLESLCYCQNQDGIFFASNLFPFRGRSDLAGELDFAALGLYWRHNYIPAPHTIYRNVKKMQPGSYLRVRPFESASSVPRHYWNPAEVFARAVSNRFTGSLGDAADELDALLTGAIKRRMSRGMSICTFLSGGIDSSLISAIAQKVSGGNLKTFSAGFDEADYNEAGYAKQVAEHIGSEHRELRVTPDMAMNFLEKMPAIYAEPFADPSQIPTTLISCYARQFADTALGGDGGDEVFGGYRNYVVTERLWRKFGGVPLPMRQVASVFSAFAASLPFVGRRNRIRGEKLSRILVKPDPESVYRIIGALSEPDSSILIEPEAASMMTDRERWARTGELKERLMFLDFCMYLPDDGVVKVRDAAQYAGLQVFAPILDHRIVEFAWSLPMRYKIEGECGKVVLKELLYRYVPKELVERPKKGFAMPVPIWLSSQMIPWANALWESSESRADALFGKGWLVRLRERYDRVNPQSRWGILYFLQWLVHA